MGFNVSLIGKILSFIAAVLGLSMIPSFLVSLIYREYHMALVFLFIAIPITAVFGFLGFHIKPGSVKMKIREGILIAASTWFLASLIGTLPYLVSGCLNSFVDALFESTASFTTTGASILESVENIPKGLVFWRSFSQWLGGMGILVFAISLLPALGVGGFHIVKAEAPGPTLNKMAPRISDTAKILYIMYGSFTLIAVILLLLGGMNLFDALIHAFGSAASGGHSSYDNGIAHFDSPYIECVLSVITILVCLNFTLYHEALRGNWKSFPRSSELKLFLCLLAGGGFLISADLWITGTVPGVFDAFRSGFFQTVSFITTTGHFNTDYNLWPSFSKGILFILMTVGACAASTGGGIKVIRVLIMFKLLVRNFKHRLHPRAVIAVKVQDNSIPSGIVNGIAAFLCLYTLIFLLSGFVISFENLDLLTTFSTALAILNNVGTGFELVGPTGDFSLFSSPVKFYLCLLMIIGRLELFTVLVLFSPLFWKTGR